MGYLIKFLTRDDAEAISYEGKFSRHIWLGGSPEGTWYCSSSGFLFFSTSM